MPAIVTPEECTACGTCVDECPAEAIIIDKDKNCAIIDEDECVECGVCEEACHTEAIKVEDTY